MTPHSQQERTVSAAHTPGPWTAGPSSTGMTGRVIWSPEGVVVGDVCGTRLDELRGENRMANARLIAAAPDLYAAARKAFAEVSELWANGRYDGLETIEALRAALAKVEAP